MRSHSKETTILILTLEHYLDAWKWLAFWLQEKHYTSAPAFRKAAAKIIFDFAGKIIADTKLANEHCSGFTRCACLSKSLTA